MVRKARFSIILIRAVLIEINRRGQIAIFQKMSAPLLLRINHSKVYDIVQYAGRETKYLGRLLNYFYFPANSSLPLL
jgi:hypothetical protein